MKKALIDGDILVYRYGFAANNDPFWICKARIDEGIMDLLTFDLEDVETYEGFLTASTGNFRETIAVTAPYKGNRSGAKPVHYDELRDYLVDAYGFQIVEGQEADDAIGIACCKDPDKTVIVTIDKDLDMIPGDHFNFVKRQRYEVKSWQALVWFYTQILTGDRVDNVIGLKGIGPVKAAKILEGCLTESDLFAKVVEAYEGNTARVIENGRLLWIRRQENQIWQPPIK